MRSNLSQFFTLVFVAFAPFFTGLYIVYDRNAEGIEVALGFAIVSLFLVLMLFLLMSHKLEKYFGGIAKRVSAATVLSSICFSLAVSVESLYGEPIGSVLAIVGALLSCFSIVAFLFSLKPRPT